MEKKCHLNKNFFFHEKRLSLVHKLTEPSLYNVYFNCLLFSLHFAIFLLSRAVNLDLENIESVFCFYIRDKWQVSLVFLKYSRGVQSTLLFPIAITIMEDLLVVFFYNQKFVVLVLLCIAKPEYNDHTRDTKFDVVVDRWSLFKGKLYVIQKTKIGTRIQKSGRCRQMVIIQR